MELMLNTTVLKTTIVFWVIVFASKSSCLCRVFQPAALPPTTVLQSRRVLSSLRCSSGTIIQSSDRCSGFAARRLFDGMPKSKKASMAGGTDRISALPDDILRHMLSFSEAQVSVRSSVLARRWRHLWKSMPVLRLTGRPQESRNFMDHLLVLRGPSPLDACLFDFTQASKGDYSPVNMWICYALALFRLRVLSVAFSDGSEFPMIRLPLASTNLTNMELTNVRLIDHQFLDFRCGPSLEQLKMTKCAVSVQRLFSSSLKCLSIEECCFNGARRTSISAPSLTSLQLTDATGKTPFLEDMPALVTATVRFSRDCWDICGICDLVSCGDISCVCCYIHSCADASCKCCYRTDDNKEGCVFLKGVSAATDLKLIAESGLILLERDLRRCPTFSKLKTLSLNEWCVAGDHRALICILQHTPVLENLTLQLSETPEDKKPVKATYNLLEQSVASENLKIVEITCEEVDTRVHNIMKSLSTYGIPLEKITIWQANKSTGCLNIVCSGFSSKPGGEDQGC
uniref:Uncharacterized protein n=1 Tax=Avena sativa TaxID=4498 RepID=A0ACD6A5W9_AVESA